MSEDDRERNDEVLAGEYVLGVLSADRRQEVERRLLNDRAFAGLVARWQANFAAFNEDYADVLPEPVTFARIEERLFGSIPLRHPFNALLSTLGFWRGVSAVTSVVAVVAIVYASGFGQNERAASRLVAELSAPASDVSLLATFDASSGRVHLVPVAAGKSDKKSLQLWLVPGSGNPQSLGVFQPNGDGDLLIPAEMRGKISDGATLAVSLEPFGGSTTGLPTGPVVASGTARRL